jgi:hypothetical protein
VYLEGSECHARHNLYCCLSYFPVVQIETLLNAGPIPQTSIFLNEEFLKSYLYGLYCNLQATCHIFQTAISNFKIFNMLADYIFMQPTTALLLGGVLGAIFLGSAQSTVSLCWNGHTSVKREPVLKPLPIVSHQYLSSALQEACSCLGISLQRAQHCSTWIPSSACSLAAKFALSRSDMI